MQNVKYEMLNRFDNGSVKVLFYKQFKQYIVEEQHKPVLTDLLIGNFSGHREVYQFADKVQAEHKFAELERKYIVGL